ncbi:hypothetical protein M7I_7553 [Glarea lozoyensis 74030]|uniref:Uncharacterized protein n=1 Tax=Glarea lozoyensis (strain ATCC 74030 / MF5533) TaxID=1104152 RepID=H0EXL6_GLAL7|nr:hypothetical protein M7I_7553 [Glarea lozoyensis 74030]
MSAYHDVFDAEQVQRPFERGLRGEVGGAEEGAEVAVDEHRGARVRDGVRVGGGGGGAADPEDVRGKTRKKMREEGKTVIKVL